ncbi:DMT family transporter [Streptomyces albidoflavus]|uniref:DMT family transporter n=1 Tax=Streptomyces TaxID=1883 RepID=UPI0013EE6A00
MPDPGVWLWLSVASGLLCVVPFLLFSWAEQHHDSGMESILNVTTPLLPLAVGAVALVGEQLERRGTAGLLAGFVGVLVLIGPSGLAGGQLAFVLACLGATCCYGVTLVYLRRYVAPLGLPVVSVVFGQQVSAPPSCWRPHWLAEPQAWGGQRLRGHPPH